MKATIPARAAIVGLLALVLSGPPLAAQQTGITLGPLHQDTSLPVEIESDSLSVNNADGTALFSGNVRVKQGEMLLAAAELRVEYDKEGKAIASLHGTGGVTFVTPTDAAEATEADYTIATGQVVLRGNVVLTQGDSTLAGQKLTLDLIGGTGVMEGRVTTTFVPGTE